MNARPNTTVTILRGTTVDQYGDEADTASALVSGVPASIIPTSRRVYLPAEGAHRVVHTVTGRAAGNTPVATDDRWRDERTGTVYLVTEVREPAVLGNLPDVVVELSVTS